MATRKNSTSVEEKLQGQDFDLFAAINAIDNKDYDYYDKLTEEQQRKFVPYMMTHWISSVTSDNIHITKYYLSSTDYHVNKHLFSEAVSNHGKLVWLMLCAASPGLKKRIRHVWVPHLSVGVSTLRDKAKVKDIREYYSKLYPKCNQDDLSELSEEFVRTHDIKHYLANKFVDLKHSDIETLSQLINNDDIKQYESEYGN